MYEQDNDYLPLPEQIEDIGQFLHEGQNPDIVLRAYAQVRALMMVNEKLINIFHQITFMYPVCLVVTSERMILYQKRFLGDAYVEGVFWRYLAHPELNEGMMWSRLKIKPRGKIMDYVAPWGKTYVIVRLPKTQARRAMALVKEQAAFWDDEWRWREYDQTRAKHGAIIFQGKFANSNTGSDVAMLPPTTLYPYQKPSTPDNKEGILPSANDLTIPMHMLLNPKGMQMMERNRIPERVLQPDPLAAKAQFAPALRLKKIKDMYEAGLISLEDYNQKRGEILSLADES
jgi:hypothetical protein